MAMRSKVEQLTCYKNLRRYGEIGKLSRLEYLSALLETTEVEPIKFGEGFNMLIPSQA